MKTMKLLFVIALGSQALWARAAQPDVSPPNSAAAGKPAVSSGNDVVAIRLDSGSPGRVFQGIS